MVTLVISVFVLAAASQMFASLLTQFKQQGKVAETSIEAAVGLEILRRDLNSAGFGLPWSLGGETYLEAPTGTDPAAFNDATSNPPRAIIANNPAFTTLNDSDYLVVKSASVARNPASGKWTNLSSDNSRRSWTPAAQNLAPNDRVIVITPSVSNAIALVSAGGFSTRFDNPANSSSSGSTYNFRPPDVFETRVIYGIDPDNDLRMPFNRADYYISSNGVPARCAPGTGVLVKAVLDHADGDFDLDGDGSADELPLLDCVADMQVVFRRDTNDDGTIDNTTDDISALNAAQTRDQVREARVYILAHEGQRDPTYTYPSSTIYVGDTSIGSGRSFDLATQIGTGWENYRWRIYAVVEKPENLR